MTKRACDTLVVNLPPKKRYRYAVSLTITLDSVKKETVTTLSRGRVRRSPHTCDECDYVAATLALLQSHIRYMHSLEKPYECPFCDYSAKAPCNTNVHIKTYHCHDPDYMKCPYCNFSTKGDALLAKHYYICRKRICGVRKKIYKETSIKIYLERARKKENILTVGRGATSIGGTTIRSTSTSIGGATTRSTSTDEGRGATTRSTSTDEGRGATTRSTSTDDGKSTSTEGSARTPVPDATIEVVKPTPPNVIALRVTEAAKPTVTSMSLSELCSISSTPTLANLPSFPDINCVTPCSTSKLYKCERCGLIIVGNAVRKEHDIMCKI